MQVDVADAVPNNVIGFVEAPEILELSTGYIITMGVILGVFFVGEVSVLIFIIYHRKHQVMKLAQAPFLALLMGCSAFTTASCTFLLQVTDVACNLFGLLLLVPLTMMAAILVGRLWRAYSMLSTILNIGSSGDQKARGENLIRCLAFIVDWRMLDCCGRSRCSRRSRSGSRRRSTQAALRTAVTDCDLLRLIVILTLPQLVLQILISTLVDRNAEIVFNASEEVGRKTCGAANWWLPLLGVVYIGILFLCVMMVAWMSRDLPSVFNEKSAIFKAGTVSGIISFLGVSLLLITDSPTTSPNVTVRSTIVP